MRTVVGVVGVLAVTLLLSADAGAGRAPQVSCKKIREAVWAGHTLDQILTEFDTDAQTVMRCTQKRGKRRAGPKQKATRKSSGTKHAPARSAAPKSKASKPDSGSSTSGGRAVPRPLP